MRYLFDVEGELGTEHEYHWEFTLDELTALIERRGGNGKSLIEIETDGEPIYMRVFGEE